MQLDLLGAVRDGLAGRYVVDEEVGRGGMAVVLRARGLSDGREVAIKVLYPDLARAVGGERFLREISILSRLSHPNILPLLDSGTVAVVAGLEVPWYAMPYVTEETLRGRLKREGALPIDLALRYTREICSALTHAHGQGFVHRDIKPENILLRGDQAVLADFGISRAVSVAGGETLSSTGIVVGTPTYMSPEQSMGSPQLDGRTDLYSLGCVLYEMLAGHPPFTGSTPQAISARHQFESLPPIRVVRPTVPEGIERLLNRALAKVPGDRVATAGELGIGLTLDARTATAYKAPSVPPRLAGRIAVGLLLTAALAGFGHWWQSSRGARPDPGRYVLIPLASQGIARNSLVSGANSARLLWEGLHQWRDLRVVDPLVVSGRLDRISGPVTLEAALALAKDLGAGRLIWGEVYALGDSIAIRASVYDATGKSLDPMQSGGIKVSRASIAPADAPDQPLVQSFRSLAQLLIVPQLGNVTSASEFSKSTSLETLRATFTGDSALERFDLDGARQSYLTALEADTANAPVLLRLMRVSVLSGAPISAWRPLAQQLRPLLPMLADRDHREAQALMAISSGDFPGACEHFRSLVATDSLGFFGWYGLGVCQLEDPIVVPDERSQSGWRFRSSQASGIAAIVRALRLAPRSQAAYGGLAVDHLAERLFAEPNKIAKGHPVLDTTREFGAYPGLDHDSVTFIPFPLNEVAVGQHLPSTRLAAVEANRELLLQVTSAWLAEFPSSVPALKAHAMSLELSGRLRGGNEPIGSALMIVDRLRSTSPHDITLSAWRIRLLIKTRAFALANALADTALQLPPHSEDERETLAAIAGLVGRPELAAQIAAEGTPAWSISDEKGRQVTVPFSLASDEIRLLAFAAAGTPEDSIRGIARRIEGAKAFNADDRSRQTLQSLLYRPRLLAFPVLRAPEGTQYHPLIEQAIQRGELVAARRLMEANTGFRQSGEPGTRSWDTVVLEARLYLLVGDSVQAREELAQALDNLDRADRWLLNDIAASSAVPVAMRLLSRLSAAPAKPTDRWAAAADSLTSRRSN